MLATQDNIIVALHSALASHLLLAKIMTAYKAKNANHENIKSYTDEQTTEAVVSLIQDTGTAPVGYTLEQVKAMEVEILELKEQLQDKKDIIESMSDEVREVQAKVPSSWAMDSVVESVQAYSFIKERLYVQLGCLNEVLDDVQEALAVTQKTIEEYHSSSDAMIDPEAAEAMQKVCERLENVDTYFE